MKTYCKRCGREKTTENTASHKLTKDKFQRLCRACDIIRAREARENKKKDRHNLEWLIYYCLTRKDPCISFDKGRELLKFKTMMEMRKWYNNCFMKKNPYVDIDWE